MSLEEHPTYVAFVTEWPRDRIYHPSTPDEERESIPFFTRSSLYTGSDTIGWNWTPEFTNAVNSERHGGGWDQLQAVDGLKQDEGVRVLRGEIPCPRCGGRTWHNLIHQGQKSHLLLRLQTPCACQRFAQFWKVWGDPMVVPELFRNVTLKSLEASPASKCDLMRQAEVIAEIKTDPGKSVLIWGPPGVGKTHIALALFRRGVLIWARDSVIIDAWAAPGVWRIHAGMWSDTMVIASTTHKGDPGYIKPVVTVDDIQRVIKKGMKPTILIDELDKMKFSTFKALHLLKLIDTVYEAKGQVICTSNDSPQKIEADWSKQEGGEYTAQSILRRIIDPPHGHAIQLA